MNPSIDHASYTLTDSERGRVESARRFETGGGVADLIGMLADPSWVVRRAVVEALAGLDASVVEPLCDVLRHARDSEARIAAAVDALVASRAAVEPAVLRLAADADPAIVADATQILGRRRASGAITVLTELTRHPNDNVAVGAIEALGRIGGRAAIEALIEAVGSGNFFRTFPAIDVLGRSGDPRVVEPLTRLLANPSYLPEASRALGRSGERAAVKPLLELLASRSDAVVRVAALSLWELRERFEDKSGGAAGALAIDELFRSGSSPETIRRLCRVLAGKDLPEALAACRLLGTIRSAEAVPMLAVQLDSDPELAACAAESLRKIGKDADGHFSSAIREGTSERRRVLLPVVTRTGSAPDVALCLGDPDADVRAIACDTLARLGNGAVAPRIFKLLSDANLRVVHAATAAIQALGTRESRTLAVEASRSPAPVVRRAALNILAYYGDSSATQPMLDGLEDADPRVREAALQGLPYLEDARALEALYEATRRPLARTRAISMRSLGQVPRPSARTHSLLLKGLTDADAWVRYYACQSLGRLAYAPAAEDVVRLLADEAGQVRVSAVEALSHLKSPAANEALRTAALSDDVDVRRAALVGLGIAHRPEDLSIVLAAASSTDAPTRLIALSSLVGFASPKVFGALSAAGRDPDEQVRTAAIGLLAARSELEATEVLIELLASESTRERARTALLVPTAGRVTGLLVALDAADDELAPMLISVLARIERPDARAAMLAAIRLRNVAARKAAATGLAARRDAEMTGALREAADNDPDPSVRRICTLLLSE